MTAPLLLWNEAAGGSLDDGRITLPIVKAINLAEWAPAGDLILQLPAARALRPLLTTLINDANEAAEAWDVPDARPGTTDYTRQQAAEPPAPVHAVPLPGSDGISSCCGRPPCEFVGEHVTRDPARVTCSGPAN